MITAREWFGPFVSEWTRWMVAMSWQVALVAAAVLIICVMARKASPRFRYFLWCLVFLKLCLPPTLNLVTGIGRWLPAERVTASTMTVLEAAPDLPERIALPVTSSSNPPPILPAKKPLSLSPTRVLFIGWALGVAGMGGLLCAQYRRIRRRLRGARAAADNGLLLLFRKARDEMGIRAEVTLFEAPELDSPILFGLWRAAVYLPAGIARELSPARMRAVLLHELAHFRRRDLLVNWLQVALQALYWFHPAVWFAGSRLRRERELVVDDVVLAQLGGERMEYGESLLSVMRRTVRRQTAAAGYVGIVETKKSLAHRLNRIMDARRKLSTRLGWASATAILALALLLIPQAGAQIASVADHAVAAPVDAPAPTPAAETLAPAPPDIAQLLLDGNAAWLHPTPKSLSYTFTMKHVHMDDGYTAAVDFTAPNEIVVAPGKGKVYKGPADDSYDPQNQAYPPRLSTLLQGVSFFGPLHSFRMAPDQHAVTLVGEESVDGKDAYVLELRRIGPPSPEQTEKWEESLRREATRSPFEYEFLPVEKEVDGEKRVVIEVSCLHGEGPGWPRITASHKEDPSQVTWDGQIVSAAIGDYHGEQVPLVYINSDPAFEGKSPITSTTFHGGIDNRTKRMVLGEGERILDEAEYERLKSEKPEPPLLLTIRVGCGIWGSWYGYTGSTIEVDRVWMEKATGAVLREEGSRDGAVQYSVEYGEHEKMPSGGLAPMRVKITFLKRPSDRGDLRPWVFDMKFATHGGKAWLLDELTESSAVTNVPATARVTNVRVE